MLFAPFACETAALIRMRASTVGTLESVKVRRGGKGTSSPQVAYSYTVRGERHVSTCFAPGFWAKGTWSGGGRAVAGYVEGQSVTVHYNPDDASEACLAYGWHPWSVGLPFFLIGLALQGWGGRREGRARRAAHVAGWTLFPLGFASIASGATLLPSSLPSTLLLAAGALSLNLLYRAVRRRF